MAAATVTRTSVVIEYAGEEGRSGGTYSFSNIKHTSPDENLDAHARAINGLQEKIASRIFKVVESNLTK